MRNFAQRFVITSLVALAITGCSSNFFDKDNLPAPSQLPQYKQQVMPQVIWSSSATSGSSDNLKMSMGSSANAIYTSSANGSVVSINKLNGYTNWRVNTPLSATSGPGVGSGIVVIGGEHGNVLALEQSTGKTRWSISAPGEVIAQPAVSNNQVIIKTVNGYIRSYAVSDGHQLWSYQSSEPSLMLRGSSAAKAADGHVIAGFANGHLVSLDASNGQLYWQQTVALPEGAFAIQRMVDIDADPIIQNRHIYAATFQGKIAALGWGAGDVLWSHDLSSYTGMSVDEGKIYVTDAQGRLWAFNADNGAIAWQKNDLEYRNLSGPAVMGRYVVVGDGQGFLHWINKNTGEYVGRAYIDKSGIFASPIAENGVLYALSNKGNLVAYKIS